MFCKNCGTEIDDQVGVCVNCGEVNRQRSGTSEESAIQKTKFRISVGLLAAAVYFLGLFGGYVITGILVGYILLMEENQWLKKQGIKAIALMIIFSLLHMLIGFVPNAIGILGGTLFVGIFNMIKVAFNMINGAVDVCKAVLFIILGLKAFSCGNIKIPVVDEIINKNME